MDFVKVQEAISTCGVLIENVLKTRAPAELKARAMLDHCLDMIKQMRGWSPDRLEKSFRWLGYIQGVMESFDVTDLETLKKMNMPTEEDEKREAASHPFKILEAELQRRLSPNTGLTNVSSDELLRLTNLAERLEEVQQQKASHREAMANLKELAKQLMPAIVASVTSKATEELPRRCSDCVDEMEPHQLVKKRDCGDCVCKAAAAGPRATSVGYSEKEFVLELSTGRTIKVPWGWYPSLAMASPEQRCNMRLIGPSAQGVGVHWPNIDEDLFVSKIVELYDRQKRVT